MLANCFIHLIKSYRVRIEDSIATCPRTLCAFFSPFTNNLSSNLAPTRKTTSDILPSVSDQEDRFWFSRNIRRNPEKRGDIYKIRRFCDTLGKVPFQKTSDRILFLKFRRDTDDVFKSVERFSSVTRLFKITGFVFYVFFLSLVYVDENLLVFQKRT